MNQKTFIDRFNSGANLFLTGAAGTGKSYVTQQAVALSKSPLVVAPTGIAAINVGGATMHSVFSLPLHPHVPDDDLPLINSEKVEVIRKAKTLFIDEISMVRCDMLDAIDQRCKQVRRNNEPFGGLQVVLIGDPYQLEPVVRTEDSDILRKYYRKFSFTAARCFQNFEAIVLQENFRQQEGEFLEILNSIRKGRHTTKHIETLNRRCCGNTRKSGVITLVSTNKAADIINFSEMMEIKATAKTFKAKIEGKINESDLPVSDNIQLKVGAQVMICRNMLEFGLVNGSIGIVHSLEPLQVNIGGDIVDITSVSWEKYEYKVTNGKLAKQLVGVFQQVPIKLAWAITIHKAQGQTYSNVHIDLGSWVTSGMTYTALSRCKTLEGISLARRITSNDIKTPQI